MNYIIDFYKELDVFNTILFWGVIIVILLLLIFAIIMVNKNRKLERIIEDNGISIDDDDNDDNELPIKKIVQEEHEEVKQEEPHRQEPYETFKEEPKNNEIAIVKKEQEKIPEQQEINNKFVAEEYVMHNNEQEFVVPSIKKAEHPKEIKMPNLEPINNELGPYQRNVLRETPHYQTSPIGITRKESNANIELNRAAELQRNLNENSEKTQNNYYATRTERVNNDTLNKERYLKEVSNKLSDQAKKENGISRTAYELQQEEDAIISYEELMRKKDEIKMVDEEDAVISIGELIKRNKEKIYNITEDTENNKFIDELKDFRSNL